jgi:WD40 repeat protein
MVLNIVAALALVLIVVQSQSFPFIRWLISLIRLLGCRYLSLPTILILKKAPNFNKMFAGENTAEVSLDLPCRTVCAILADRNESQFLVGSCTTSETNHIHVLHYNNTNDEMNVRAQLVQEQGPLEVICSSPKDPTLLCTAHSSSQLLIQQFPDEVVLTTDCSDDRMDTTSVSTEQLITLQTNGIVSDISWGDESTGELLFIARSGHLTQFDIETQQSIRTLSLESPSSSLPRLQWDPHANGHAVAVSAGKRVHLLDWRTDTSIPTGTVDAFVAHRRPGHVTALDYNPNKPYVLATGGQDGLVQFWDLRLTNRPLLVARGGYVLCPVVFESRYTR